MLHRLSLATAALLAITASASAQQVLKHEPPQGGMRSGEVVLVDDGKCPKGMINKVTAGTQVARNPTLAGAQARTRQCVPRG